MSETRAIRVQHKCDTSATRTTRVRYECYTNDTSVTQMKNFDFDKDTSKKTYFHTPYIYMASGRLQGDEQFYSRNYFSEMPCSHAKMSLKSVPKNLSLLMAKAI